MKIEISQKSGPVTHTVFSDCSPAPSHLGASNSAISKIVMVPMMLTSNS